MISVRCQRRSKEQDLLLSDSLKKDSKTLSKIYHMMLRDHPKANQNKRKIRDQYTHYKNLFREIIAENFLSMGKEITYR